MRVVVFGALNGALAMGLGAFSAHVLSGAGDGADPQSFQTAVSMHLILSAVLIAIGGLKGYLLPSLMNAASWLIGLGMVLFAGGIYAQTFGAPEVVGLAVPVGGALAIFGFLVLAIGGARRI